MKKDTGRTIMKVNEMGICQDYGITFGELKEYNPGVEDWNSLDVGQRLYLGDTDD